MAAYATPDEWADRYDANDLGQLASDTGQPIGDLSTSTRLLALLADASGRVESAATVGGLYTAADLAALTGNSGSDLKRLVCDLAMCFLLEVRPGKYTTEFIREKRDQVEARLEQLRKGVNIFNVDSVIEGGKATTDGPSAVEYQTLNLITSRTRNTFPSVAQRLPLGRG